MSLIDAEQHGRWYSNNSCNCATRYYYSVRIAHEQCPLTHGLGIVGSNGFSTIFKGGLASAHHHYVEVTYKCDRCNHRFRKTYELRKGTGTGEKKNRKGYYANVDEVHHSSDVRVSYDNVEAVFESMWSGYSAVNYNCYTWAVDFYPKVIARAQQDSFFANIDTEMPLIALAILGAVINASYSNDDQNDTQT